MHLVMFDVDGTLVDSSGFEDECFLKAIHDVIKTPVDSDWSNYAHVTDTGILNDIIDRNGLAGDREHIHSEVKRSFIRYVQSYLSHTRAREIEGAAAFIQNLRRRDDVALAIATGGWEETARLKLTSAGIDHAGIAFASGSDHTTRTGIMKIAEEKTGGKVFIAKTYFGDAIWDLKASRELNYNFILVGDRIHHPKQIMDFHPSAPILALIGL